MSDNKNKKRSRSLKLMYFNSSVFVKYFASFLVLELICFIILGITYAYLGTNNWTNQKQQLLKENASSVARLTGEVIRDRLNEDVSGSMFMLCNNIKMISEAIDGDVYVCNMKGKIIICKDLISDDYVVQNDGNCAFHGSFVLPENIIEQASIGNYSDNYTTLDGTYQHRQIVAAEPVTVNGEVVSVVFAVTPISNGASDYLAKMVKSFAVASVTAFLIGAIITYFFTQSIIAPLKDMSKATKAYANGDFSYRVKEKGSQEFRELLHAFNSMASDLALHESTQRSFVANVSHELKTPMTTIGGFIDGILDGTIPPEMQKHYLEIVSNETKRLSRLVVSMLNLSKIEAGELKLKPTEFNICNDIFDVLVSFERTIEQKNIEICGLDKLMPITVNADEDMIHQVIYNLVDNAVKFTNNGKIIVNANKDSKGVTTVQIRNTGVGISSEDLNRIFERFYKVDKSRSFDTKSTGLGLYIVKTIIEMHGGSIKAESIENEYTQFEFTLPGTVTKNK